MASSKSKSERIVSEALCKAVEIIIGSRVTVLESDAGIRRSGSGSMSSSGGSGGSSSSHSRPTPFGLDVAPCKAIREAMEPWKTNPYKPLILHIFCSSRSLSFGDTYSSQDASGGRRTATQVTLLEEWTLHYNMAANSNTGMCLGIGEPEDVKPRSNEETRATLHEVYRHFSVFLRSLYSMVRALPAWTIRKKNRARLGFCFRPSAAGEGGLVTWSGSKNRRRFARPLEFSVDAQIENFKFSPILHVSGTGGGCFATSVAYDSYAPAQLLRSRTRPIPIPKKDTSTRNRRDRPPEKVVHAHSMPSRLEGHRHHYHHHHHHTQRRVSRGGGGGPPLHSQPPTSRIPISTSLSYGGYHQHPSGASTDPPLRRHAPHASFDSEPDIHTYDRRRLSDPTMNTRHSTLSAHSLSDQRARSGSHGHYRIHSNSSTEFKPGSAPTGGFLGSYEHSAGSLSSPGLHGSPGSYASNSSLGREIHDSPGSHGAGIFGGYGSRASTPPSFELPEPYQASVKRDMYLSPGMTVRTSSFNRQRSPSLQSHGDSSNFSLALAPRLSAEERAAILARRRTERTVSEEFLDALTLAAKKMTPKNQIRRGDIFTPSSAAHISSSAFRGLGVAPPQSTALALNTPQPLFPTDAIGSDVHDDDSAFVGASPQEHTFDYSDDDDDECPFALEEDLRDGDGGRASRRDKAISDFLNDCKAPRSVPHFCQPPYHHVHLSALDAVLNTLD